MKKHYKDWQTTKELRIQTEMKGKLESEGALKSNKKIGTIRTSNERW